MANSFGREGDFGFDNSNDPFLRGCELSASNATALRANGALIVSHSFEESPDQESLGMSHASLGSEAIGVTSKSMGFEL